jgi:hypothetical protein
MLKQLGIFRDNSHLISDYRNKKQLIENTYSPSYRHAPLRSSPHISPDKQASPSRPAPPGQQLSPGKVGGRLAKGRATHPKQHRS